MPKNSSIKAIDRKSIHQICSGQVVLTLATAVKELVENSIDAGATNVDVKLKEYGSELVEVSDNGCGVKECDFKSLTLKHHTSKIEDFSDLLNVDTFGFRGEALSSLCALGKMTVVTCHKLATVGTRLEYDHDGTLIKQTLCARQIGTTVSIENLFSSLPVRHKEFVRNLRREFSKMVNLLTAYCIISSGTRITCVNTTAKGRKTTVLTTSGESTMKGRLLCLFGSKQVTSLLEFVQKSPSAEFLEEFGLKNNENKDLYRIEGYVSPPAHGEGRSSGDRLFWYVNGRPCDIPKATKVIYDVYHSFNRQQYPFICLNIILNKNTVDINVTPDKRQVFVPEEKLLLATLKESILAMYGGPSPNVMQFRPLLSQKTMDQCQAVLEKDSLSSNKPVVLSDFMKRFVCKSKDSCQSVTEDANGTKDIEAAAAFPAEVEASDHGDHEEAEEVQPALKNSSLLEADEPVDAPSNVFPTLASQFSSSQNCSVDINATSTQLFNEEKIIDKVKVKDFDSPRSVLLQNLSKFACQSSTYATSRVLKKKSKPGLSPRKKKIRKTGSVHNVDHCDIDIDLFIRHEQALMGIDASKDTPCDSEMSEGNQDPSIEEDAPLSLPKGGSLQDDSKTFDSSEEIICTDEPAVRQGRRTVTCNFSFDSVKAKWKSKNSHKTKNGDPVYRRFRSKFNADEAEDELRKEISKDMFAKMKIIGQFNLGFIITKLDEDLFIIDQHATDEKYNFELLQRETVLETQLLLNPQVLELTAASETILLDNIHIFEANGFKFQINEDGKVGRRVQLISVPVSQNWTFGKSDVDELLFMLTDNSGCMCRPSRVSQMFASRACRKSVMIGTALSQQLMKKLVCHMGEIDHPWNCPHGRPTMRHLLNLNILYNVGEF